MDVEDGLGPGADEDDRVEREGEQVGGLVEVGRRTVVDAAEDGDAAAAADGGATTRASARASTPINGRSGMAMRSDSTAAVMSSSDSSIA